ncbi:hypothetical protein ACIOG7_10625 [Streptomyces sp. NPDC087894]|uniref:hypothetical protein n=1 Tax=Streptomyces sp. NPDC087894 TaxID=3365816 RepID=UPI0038302628
MSESTATVELSDGTVTLTDWSLVELTPDFYGHSHMQIGGWLPKGYQPGLIAQGTNHMVRADLPGIPDVAQAVNVTVETKGYGGPQRFMKIQWRHLSYPANWLDTLRDTGKLPAPLSAAPVVPEEPALTRRQQLLLAKVRESAGLRWTTGVAQAFYRGLGYANRGLRHGARSDLHELAALGHLTVHGPDDGRYFLYVQPKESA